MDLTRPGPLHLRHITTLISVLASVGSPSELLRHAIRVDNARQNVMKDVQSVSTVRRMH